MLAIEYLTVLEEGMMEDIFFLILEEKVDFSEDQYYKCYQLIIRFFELLEEENSNSDTVEIGNIPLLLLK